MLVSGVETGFVTGFTSCVVIMGRRKCAIGDSGEIGEGGEGGVGRRAKFKKRAWLSQKPDEVQLDNKLHIKLHFSDFNLAF